MIKSLSICLVISFNIIAQAPGYMGKKLSIGYSFNTMPALWGSNANNKTISGAEGNAETGCFAFNVIHELSLDYCIKSQWQIGLSVRYYKTTFDNPTLLTYAGNEVDFSKFQKVIGYYNITGQSYTLLFKKYGEKYLAPWGKYFMFGPVFNTATANYDPSIMSAVSSKYDNNSPIGKRDSLITDFGNQAQKYKGVNFMIGRGRSRIIANHLILDYGWNCYLFSFFPNVILTYKNNLSNTNYISKTISRRVRGINNFNVFFKIGYLF